MMVKYVKGGCRAEVTYYNHLKRLLLEIDGAV